MESSKKFDRPGDIRDKEHNTYSCIRYMAKGGFSKVYEVKQNNLHVLCGKFIAKESRKRNTMDLFREIEIHQKLKHRNILQLKKCIEDRKYFCLILEYCTNKSMSELIKRRRGLTECEIRFYGKQVLSGVKYLHANNIIHRDLKPQNILINNHMVLKIADFGLATEVSSRLGKVRKKTIYGTPTYISPEMVDNRVSEYNHKVDIWAIGVLLYDMYSGRPPFTGSTITKIYETIKIGRYEIPSGMPHALSSLIRRTLQIDPARRPDVATIQKDPFFTCGFTPKTLPKSALVEPPKFMENTSDVLVLDRFISSSVLRPSNLTSRTLKTSVITCSQPSTVNFCDRNCARGLFYRLRNDYGSVVSKDRVLSSWQESELEAPHLDPVVWITDFLDCKNIFNCVAYSLNTEHIGAMFADDSVVNVLSSTFVQYIDSKTSAKQIWRVNDCPTPMRKKIDALKMIYKHISNAVENKKMNTVSKDSEWIGLMPHLVFYEATPNATITLLSTGLFQIHYKKVKTILCPKLKAFSIITDEGEVKTYYLSSLDKYGHPKEIHDLISFTFSQISRLLIRDPCFICRKQVHKK